MYADLHKVEVLAYVTLWLCGILTSIYSILLRKAFIRNWSSDSYFVSGWDIVDSEKDVTDYEWETWLSFLALVFPWIIAHCIGSWLVRSVQTQLIPLWHTIVAAIFLVWYIGSAATVFLFMQPCMFYILSGGRSKTLLWSFSIVMLFWIHGDATLSWLELPNNVEYMFHAALGWTHMRCLSFTLDRMEQFSYKENLRTFVDLLGYCFYLPTLFLGPLILYKEFQAGVKGSSAACRETHVVKLFLKTLRYVFWLLISDLSLHFLYFNALLQQPHIVRKIDWWSLCGLGYCMGQFFMNKYVTVYGLAGSIAEAEQIAAPNTPKCIARVHLYSDMWRNFDRGLYLFLVKYIYIPCRGRESNILKQMWASFVCFLFIYLWHNTYNHVLVWSVLNFIGVTVEGTCRRLAYSSAYQKLEKRMLSPRNARRFKAIIASPLFVMSAISSFYFLGGMEIGNIFIGRVFGGPFLINLTLLMFCYCGCQVSMEVKNWEQRRESKR